MPYRHQYACVTNGNRAVSPGADLPGADALRCFTCVRPALHLWLLPDRWSSIGPCLVDVGFPPFGLQDRIYTSNLLIMPSTPEGIRKLRLLLPSTQVIAALAIASLRTFQGLRVGPTAGQRACSQTLGILRGGWFSCNGIEVNRKRFFRTRTIGSRSQVWGIIQTDDLFAWTSG